MPQLSQKQLIFLGVGAVLVLGVLYLLFTGTRSSVAPPKITLAVWGTEPAEAINPVISAYRQIRENVTVTYIQKDPARYQSEVLNALASGQGPDVYMIDNRSLAMELNRLSPADPAQYTPVQAATAFPDVVSRDFVWGGKVYALPLYLDTLALFYNKDSLNQAALVAPPATWTDVQNFVPFLRKTDANGQPLTPAVALGGSAPGVTRAPDILAALMLQNGSPLSDAAGNASFVDEKALQAMNFYLQFSNPQSPGYTWSDSLGRDLDLFAAGKLGLVFGYQSDAAAIRLKSPFLNFGIAPFPQTGPSAQAGAQVLSYPSYQGWAVAKQSQSPAWGWDFVLYFTTYPDNEKMYLAAAKRPPALRTLIAADVNDAALGVFARQALTARSWFEGNPAATEGILNEAIRNVLSGKNDSRAALQQAQDQVNAILKGAR